MHHGSTKLRPPRSESIWFTAREEDLGHMGDGLQHPGIWHGLVEMPNVSDLDAHPSKLPS